MLDLNLVKISPQHTDSAGQTAHRHEFYEQLIPAL